MISRETGVIDWSKSAREISKLICGMNSWPLACTKYKDGILKIVSARVCDENSDKEAGEILALEKGKVKNVTLNIKDALILDKVNLSVEKGSICGLVGRNGSGKTMLMKCICGFIPVTEGEILVNNQKVGVKDKFAENLGFIIETPGFMPNYTAYKNLEFLSSINSKVNKQRIREVIELVGLDPDSKKKVGKFSLGMNQRLGLAQAIIDNPDLLILDEPFNGLDNDGVKQIRKLLLTLKEQGKTIIMASHTKEDINILCDRVCFMDNGRLILGTNKENE